VWPAPPPKDPDVWSGPTHAQQPEPGRVRPVRGPKKAETTPGSTGKSGRTSRTSATSAKKGGIATYGQAAAASVPSAAAKGGKADKGVKKAPPGGAKKDDKSSNDKVLKGPQHS
jgi:hypothetical protein